MAGSRLPLVGEHVNDGADALRHMIETIRDACSPCADELADTVRRLESARTAYIIANRAKAHASDRAAAAAQELDSAKRIEADQLAALNKAQAQFDDQAERLRKNAPPGSAWRI